jgi:hypothetical protein
MLVLFKCFYFFVDIKIHNLIETSKGYLLLNQVINPLFLRINLFLSEFGAAIYEKEGDFTF